ncbi:hypothetical protein ACFL57_05315, partial [Candidatus Margulisiibacteriota bacterium]
EFKLFDALTGGTELWTTSDSTVDVIQGVYSVELGDANNPIDPSVLAGGSAYLQITLELQTFSPRMKINSVGYALQAGGISSSGAATITANGNISLIGGQVGIGTTAPGAKLEVYDGNIIIGDPDTDSTPQLALTNDEGGWVVRLDGSDGDKLILRKSGGANQGTKMVIQPDGSVGIGTVAPNAELEVAGTVSANAFVGDGSGLSGVSSTDTGWDHTATENIILGTNWLSGDGGDEGVFVSSNGSVGIGTTAPDALLNIYANAPEFRFTSDQGPYAFINMNTDGALSLRADEGNTGFGSINFRVDGTQRMVIDNNGDVGIGDADPATELEVAGTVSASAFVKDGVAIQEGKWDGTTTINYMGGNVGIGTTAPDYITDIQFSQTGEGKGLRINNTHADTDDIAPIYFGVHGAGARRIKSAIGLKRTGSYGVGDLLFAVDSNNDDNDVTFANDTKMVIDSAGSVGIGTTAPEAPMHVYGGDSGAGTLDGNTLLGLESDESEMNFEIKGSDSSVQQLLFKNTSGIRGRVKYDMGTEVMSMYAGGVSTMHLNDGNVGIGTTAPAAAAGFSAAKVLQIENADSSSGGQLIIGSTDAGVEDWVFASHSNGLFIRPSDAAYDALFIAETSGRVGIGTASPIGELEVRSEIGTAGAENPILVLKNPSTTDNTNTDMVFSFHPTTGYYGAMIRGNLADYTNKYYDLQFMTRDDATWDYTPEMVIRYNGNVGIGTTEPGNTLEVGSGWIGVAEGIIKTGDYALTHGGADGSDTHMLSLEGGGGAGVARGAYIKLYGDDHASYPGRLELSAGASGYNYIVGNVGIGTTNPVEKLDVNGYIHAKGIELQSLVVGNSWFSDNVYWDGSNFRYRADGYGSLYYHSQGNLIFYTSPTGNAANVAGVTERMRISNNGSVGIGSAAPQTKVEIAGDFDASSSTGSHSNVDKGLNILKKAGDYSLNDLYGLTFSTSNGGGTNYVVAGVFAEPTHQSAYLGGSLHFLTKGGNDASLSKRMTILKDGSVGIGTTNPVGKLSIQGTGTYNSSIWGQNADFNIRSSEMGDDAAHPIIQFAAIRQSLTTGSASEGYIGFSSIDDSNDNGVFDAARIQLHNETDSVVKSPTAISFWTNTSPTINTTPATEKMRITAAGNVGIGTTNPGAKLEVSGAGTGNDPVGITIRNPNASNGTTQNIYFRNGNNLHAGIGAIYNSGGNGVLIFSTQQSSGVLNERMRIKNNGYVGIGTTNPGAKLEIAGADAVSNIFLSYDESGGGSVPADTVYAQIDARDDNSNRIGARIEFKSVGTPTTGQLPTDMIFKTTLNNAEEANDPAGERMRITSAGSVGIGTTNPGYKFNVKGTSSQSAALAAISSPTGNVSLMLGDTYYTTVGMGVNEYSTALRFNGAGVVWGDISYYPTASNATGYGKFRFSQTGATVYSVPNAKVGVGALYAAGKIGIGTTNPLADLHVIGNVNIGTYGSQNSEALGVYNGNIMISSSSDSSDRAGIIFEAIGNDNVNLHLGHRYSSGSDYVKQLTILSGGEVGIGTTAPTDILSLKRSYAANAWKGIEFANDYGVSALVGARNPSTHGTLDLVFFTNPHNIYGHENLVERMVIKESTGYVGIGTATPNAKLHIMAGTPSTEMLILGVNSSNLRRVTAGTGGTGGWQGILNLYDSGNNKDVEISAGGDTYFNGGNVGIGTTDPDTRLHTYGTDGLKVQSSASNKAYTTYGAWTINHVNEGDYQNLNMKVTDTSGQGTSYGKFQIWTGATTAVERVSV